MRGIREHLPPKANGGKAAWGGVTRTALLRLAPTAERPKFLNVDQLTQEGKVAGAELVRGHSAWAAGQCKLSSKFLCQDWCPVPRTPYSSFPLTMCGPCVQLNQDSPSPQLWRWGQETTPAPAAGSSSLVRHGAGGGAERAAAEGEANAGPVRVAASWGKVPVRLC